VNQLLRYEGGGMVVKTPFEISAIGAAHVSASSPIAETSSIFKILSSLFYIVCDWRHTCFPFHEPYAKSAPT
jgi:hypothetical protein